MRASRNFKDVISLMEGERAIELQAPLGPCRNTYPPFSGSAVLVYSI